MENVVVEGKGLRVTEDPTSIYQRLFKSSKELFMLSRSARAVLDAALRKYRWLIGP
jgi:hypothetical protein